MSKLVDLTGTGSSSSALGGAWPVYQSKFWGKIDKNRKIADMQKRHCVQQLSKSQWNVSAIVHELFLARHYR